MLTAILVVLIHKYRKTHPGIFDFIRINAIKITTLVILLFLTLVANSQKKYTYNISMNGKSVGELSLIEKASPDSLVLDIRTNIVTRMIFMFRINSYDKTVFENGRLRYSYTSRQVNKGRKSTTEMHDMGSVYHSQKEGKITSIYRSPIYHNMSSLYLTEPLTMQQVYSDVFQEFVNIILVGPHHYKIKLPDGNYNEYYYADGVCRTIKINNTLYKAQMQLRSINRL